MCHKPHTFFIIGKVHRSTVGIKFLRLPIKPNEMTNSSESISTDNIKLFVYTVTVSWLSSLVYVVKVY